MSTQVASSSSKSISRIPEGVLGIYPNKWQRKFLAERWRHMTPEEQLVVRASRTKRGIRCYVCNSPGVFRENCPNGCQSPPPTPRPGDSDDSSDEEENQKKEEEEARQKREQEEAEAEKRREAERGPTAVFWGSSGAEKAKEEASLTIYEMRQKLDFVKLRAESTELVGTMRKKDEETVKGDFAFFEQATESYARNAAELTLHQLMRRMMRLVEKELLQNATKLESSFDTTLLVPPFEREGKTFYPEEFLKNPEYREYFFKKNANKGLKKAHQHQGRLRPSDDLDSVFRGPSTKDDFLYKTRPNAGESIHAKNTWKSVYGQYDFLANSDPSLAAKQRRLEKIFHEQGQWIRLQKQNMEFRNDRFEHLIFILRRELEKEHAREAKVLLTDTSVHSNAAKDSAVDVFQERLQAVDLMTHVLETYRFTAGGEEADFLLYCMHQWQEILQKKKVLGVRQSQVRRVGKKRRTAAAAATAAVQAAGGLDGSDADDDDGDDDDGDATDAAKATATAAGASSDAVDDGDDADAADFLQSLQRAAEQEKKDKAAREEKKRQQQQRQQQQGGVRDLVAAENPYYHDLKFLEAVKKKERRLFEKSKTGRVFTAQSHREAEAEAEKKRNDRRKALESMTLTSPLSPHATMAQSSATASASAVALPSMDEILSMAKEHSDRVAERDERLKEQQRRFEERTKEHDPKVPHRFVHPRERDAQRIAQREAAFRHAQLGNRIRKGNDDDHAHALPALIPIPRAFDGNSQSISHTAQNIIYGLKKDMVLSDLGYSPQTAVPLYVRTTLVEKEGTSKNGDPTQDELALDRRYSHYLGRPMIRFNNPASSTLPSSSAGSSTATTSTATMRHGTAGIAAADGDGDVDGDGSWVEDLTALNFASSVSTTLPAHSTSLLTASPSKAESLLSLRPPPSAVASTSLGASPSPSRRSAHPKLYLPPRDHHHPQAPLPPEALHDHSDGYSVHSGSGASSAASSATESRLWQSAPHHHAAPLSPHRAIGVRHSSDKRLPSSSASVASQASSQASSQGMHGYLVMKKTTAADAAAAADRHLTAAQRQQKEKEEEKQRKHFEKKYNPLTKSLVRMVFTNPQPTLDDLKYLDDDF